MTDLFSHMQKKPKKYIPEIVPKEQDPTNKPEISKMSMPQNNLPSFPLYPLCKSLTGLRSDNSFYLGCVSVFKELGNHTSQLYIRKRLRKAAETGLHSPLVELTPDLVWSNEDHTWQPLSTEKDYCVDIQHLKEFINWAQLRTRKPLLEKQNMFAKFNISLNEDDVKQIKVPIENEILDVLRNCLPFQLEEQYRVGKYRLDAFIPRLRIGIQIDEHGHKNYPLQEEKEYDEVLRDNNIVCIRFNPHEKYLHKTPALELVKRVWERTLSPDFTVFRKEFKLV